MRQAQGLARLPLLSYGFRPFFFGGALWSACAMPLWIALVTGHLQFAVSYGAVAWHAHEFVFGYVAAIVGGFLLTAIPNWTGRLPVRGGPLVVLFALWVAGRMALLVIDRIGFVPAVAIESLFLAALAAVIFREIIAGRDRRNVKVAVLVTMLATANILFHLEIYAFGMATYSVRAAVAVIVGLVALIGGRITPSFTHNWLVKQASDRLPTPFGRYDVMSLSAGAFALVLWVVMPEAPVTGVALLITGLLHALRLSRWTGASTWREPLVFILHTGYAFVPLGFLLVGSAALWPSIISASGALHAWTTGAMGVMTLAVMTRASLGHSGQGLTASSGTQAIYVAIVAAALMRIAASVFDNLSVTVLTLAAATWTAAFVGFVALYGPMLFTSRRAAQ